MEAPRLSVAVEARLFPTKNLHAATVDEQLMARQLALRDTLARATSTGSASSGPATSPTTISCTAGISMRKPTGGVSGQALDWPTFAGPYMGSGEQHVRAVKAQFNKFIGTISGLFGEADSEIVQAAAYECYAYLQHSSGVSEAERRAHLRGIFGEMSPSDVNALSSHITELNKWRSRLNIKPDISLSAASSAAADTTFTPLRTLFGASATTSIWADFGIVLSATAFSPLDASTYESSKSTSSSAMPSADVASWLGLTQKKADARPAVKVDELWLLGGCSQFLSLNPNDAFTPEKLGLTIIELFQKNKGRDSDSEARLQSALFETLGDCGFDFMQQLMENKPQVATISVQDFRRICAAADASSFGEGARSARAQPSIGPGVSVYTESDLRAAKEQRRIDRRLGRQKKNLSALAERMEELGIDGDGSTNLQALVAAGFDTSYIEQERSLGLRQREGRGRGLISVDEAIAAVGAGYGGAAKTMLPEGTIETTHEHYKQVVVPPSKLPGTAAAINLVAVSGLHTLAQLAFKGITKLNRLQSELFDAAYSSNENLLVCAPTGAGKTNVAMLTICHQILQHLSPDGRVRKDELKIIYVAPMKALAQEIVAKFSQRLAPVGLVVRELTGDMQLTKKEIAETQIIVTTPEKWDVITRKAGDGSLVSLVKLLIIDEVHLLADDRGAVIESIVARTLRLVESSQSAIRIVGLSATLPNYQDVSLFLRVNPTRGLFYFNDAYRPVPLHQTFIGVTEVHPLRRANMMNQVAFEKAMAAIKRGKQVMIFVHSRKDTAKTSQALVDLARGDGSLRLLSPFSEEAVMETGPTATGTIQGEGRISLSEPQWVAMQKEIERSKNKDLRDLFRSGFGIHHAGMLRSDRNLSERMFAAGVTKILVCTATLAWGVNLPAHTVIIKGTQIYNAESGGFTDLGMLDVMQIFGRAGRPQFDTSGEGIIITAHEKLQHYLQMLVQSVPIESSFIKSLPDHLNAEIVSGTVTNLREAVSWLSYTYLYIRMLRNPISYGVPWEEQKRDPMLDKKRVELITQAAKRLDLCHMIRFDDISGNLAVTDLGRVASHYYIYNESIETFNHIMEVMPSLSDGDMLALVCSAQEFKNIKVRDEELVELDSLKRACHIPIKGDVSNTPAKVNVLMQAYISQLPLTGFTLISDTAYITQSAGRIARALFEIFLRKGWCSLADRMLTLSKTLDKRLWWDASPVFQLVDKTLNAEEARKIAEFGAPLDELCNMDSAELGSIIRHPKNGKRVAQALAQLPYLEVDASVQPITRGVLRITLKIYAAFQWNDRLHFTAEPFYVWIEDAENEHIYHHEYVMVTKKHTMSDEPTVLTFAIPIFEPLPSQYWVKVVSDRWLGIHDLIPISFKHLVLPTRHPPHTDLLDLSPIPVTALHNPAYETMYSYFSHFNPVQSQLFHVAYHSDTNILLGAPTGSGKTVAAELALFRLWNAHPGAKAVYVAPLKALVSERMKDWVKKFKAIKKHVVELTGDFTPDLRALKEADVIITTPEKWDSISRGWQRRNYVQRVGLVIIDEIHLLGEERGPVLEIIVSRMRYISSQTAQPIRLVGLSTALANARDLADWLGIEKVGLYNFRPSVRPIPMEVHIQGFPGKHYCPRMATMNKPTYAAISTYSPNKPALIFVSSRRQTRLTALDLIAMCASDEEPKRFLHMEEAELDALSEGVKDTALKHTLAFGIGIHHAGLPESDRNLVEELYAAGKIQVLVCTSTLAWGVNFPAHLVVVKGTEYFDAKTSRYVDYPITDVLQMMGRAGRPQFDNKAVAVILVHEPKKNFYRKFLYEPFPVESHLQEQLVGHFNAEIAGGTITCRADAVEYLTWTYFFRRLLQNPTYYGLEDSSNDGIKAFLFRQVDDAFEALHASGCILRGAEALEALKEDLDASTTLPLESEVVAPSTLGYITSVYYLHHSSVGHFKNGLAKCTSYQDLLQLVCGAHEFSELPVRHNEDELNATLASELPWKLPGADYLSPHVKAFLLLQARFAHAPLPITDFISDTKSVLDQAIRVLHAVIDVAADAGLLEQTLKLCDLTQCVVMACFPDDDDLLQLRGVAGDVIPQLRRAFGLKVKPPLQTLLTLPQHQVKQGLEKIDGMTSAQGAMLLSHLRRIPRMSLDVASALHDPAVAGSQLLTVKVSALDSVPSAAVTPFYQKQKEWSWWIAVGDESSGELLALKKIVGCAPSTHEFCVETKSKLVKCYLLSDTMKGIDYQVSVDLK